MENISKEKSNDNRCFKIRGVITSCVQKSESTHGIVDEGFERVLLKIHLDKTGLENPDKWETCMLLNDKLANSKNNCLFLDAMVTAEQWFYSEQEGSYIFEVHQHTEKD